MKTHAEFLEEIKKICQRIIDDANLYTEGFVKAHIGFLNKIEQFESELKENKE